MATSTSRRSPSGPVSQYKTTVVMAAVTTCGTATVTAFTVAVPGARVTDVVNFSVLETLPAGIGQGGAHVSAAGVVECYYVNPTAAQIVVNTVTVMVEVNRDPVDGQI